MYCPRCLTEYREGFLECSDCRVALAPGPPPEAADEHSFDLVTVLETGDSFALKLAKASLEDAGIIYIVGGDEPRYLAGFPGAFGVGEAPLCNCVCRIRVARECAEEARSLLEPLEEAD